MGKKYQVLNDDAEVVNFCLNCKKKRCGGNCEELKNEKKRIAKQKKRGKK